VSSVSRTYYHKFGVLPIFRTDRGRREEKGNTMGGDELFRWGRDEKFRGGVVSESLKERKRVPEGRCNAGGKRIT